MKFLIFLSIIFLIRCEVGHRTCEKGWTLFNRRKGAWCVKALNLVANYNEAQEKCQEFGAKLSSLENQWEFGRVIELLKDLPTGDDRAWLGGELRYECSLMSHDTGDHCCNRFRAFDWTDGFVEGTDGFAKWLYPVAESQHVYKNRTGLFFRDGKGLDDFEHDTKLQYLVCGKKSSCGCGHEEL